MKIIDFEQKTTTSASFLEADDCFDYLGDEEDRAEPEENT